MDLHQADQKGHLPLHIGDRVEFNVLLTTFERSEEIMTGCIVNVQGALVYVKLDKPVSDAKKEWRPHYIKTELNKTPHVIDYVIITGCDILKSRTSSQITSCKNDVTEFRERLKFMWKDLVFRQVKKVTVKREDIIQYHRFDISNKNVLKEEIISPFDIESGTEDYDSKWMIPAYASYYGVTESRALRGDVFKEIGFRDCNFDTLDFIQTKSLAFNKYDISKPGRQFPPTTGQLICGLVSCDQRRTATFTHWFRCSDQFFNLWTLVMFGEEHKSFTGCDLDEIVRKLNTHRNRLWLNDPQITIRNKVDSFKIWNIFLEDSDFPFPNVYRFIAKIAFNCKLFPIDIPSSTFRAELIRSILF